jgi:hypothetical protein
MAAQGGGEDGEKGGAAGGMQMALYKEKGGNSLMVRSGKGPQMPKPEWHAPWKLMKVILALPLVYLGPPIW